MNNGNREKTVKNIRNIVIIIAVILLIFIIYMINYNNNYDKRIKEKLIKNNYTEMIENIYNKNENKNTTQTNYIYNIKNKEFSKSITSNDNNAQKHISLSYKNKKISITYLHKSADGCTMTQEGTYEKNDFTCYIINNTTCKSQCDVMLKEAKKFKKEAEELLK